jgi:hypothetical protein
MLPELEALKSLFLHEWDPIGVSDVERAKDEYDTHALQVFTMLAGGADDRHRRLPQLGGRIADVAPRQSRAGSQDRG